MVFPTIGVNVLTGRSGLATNAFGKRLGEYKDWREELAAIISDYQIWVENQGLGHSEDDLRVYELIEALKSDKLVIALVAEFSRGKTELINSIFFAEYKQRLLPSDAGRTTMCPTELLCQEQEAPCLKLLSIDTRASSLTLAEYKRMPEAWQTLPLLLDEPKRMAETLQQLVKTRIVSVHEAEELGLYDVRAPETARTRNGQVEIPQWRHAVVNFPHPLLRQGLVILDTPGLNSLGAEPELTLGLLPSAHAVLFVLAADTGVTKSDLDVWTNHVCAARQGPSDAQLVVLNKIDTLWDELRDTDAIAASLDRQMEETAVTLGVSRGSIFPVSAQKGLLGKIKADQSLLERSGLSALEDKLSSDVIAAKQTLMRAKITREIGTIIENTRAMIDVRLSAVNAQLTELRGLSGKSHQAIRSMVDRMREEKQAYDQALVDFQSTRAMLSEQTKLLLDCLKTENFDALMARSRTTMKESWTTQGLQAGMKTLFDGANDAMDKAHHQAQQVAAQVQTTYHKLHAEHGLAKLKPAAFSIGIFRTRLQRLSDEAEAFRKSPMTLMTEQRFLIKKFLVTLGSRARQIYAECDMQAREWSKAIMAPILTQLREHKNLMDQRLDNLKRVHENLDNLGDRIADLEVAKQNLESQLRVIDNMLNKVQPSPPALS